MRTYTVLAIMASVALLAGVTLGDPYPNQILKFSQKPLNGPAYFGHDELSTAYIVPDTTEKIYAGTAMADDFADIRITTLKDQPAVHVRWWGSYIGNEIFSPVDKFLIAFESDVPAGAADFSHPGDVLLSQVVQRTALGAQPPAGGFTEKMINPNPGGLESLYEYNAELSIPFPQLPDTVYWLKIVALVDAPAPVPGAQPETQWGWHDRDYTVQNPLASTPPAVVPGEVNLGPIIDSTGGELDVWHFQDDAVTSLVNIMMPTSNR